MRDHYKQVRAAREKPVRVAIDMPKQEVETLDAWAVEAGMANRTLAIRHLVKQGLAVGGQIGAK